MAPIFAVVGITPQIIDDERLRTMRSSLEAVELKLPLNYMHSTSDEVIMPLDIERFVTLIKPWQSWEFEEQVINDELFYSFVLCFFLVLAQPTIINVSTLSQFF